MRKGINRTVNNPDQVTHQRGGRTLYERNFGRVLGTRGEKIQRVAVDKFGNVITSFPASAFKIPGANLGIVIFGNNFIGHAANFFNPLSDLQDIVDLVGCR